jgi:aminopeptidase N
MYTHDIYYNMKKTVIIIKLWLFIAVSVNAQDITGEWHEISDSTRIFNLNIVNENGQLKGTYDLANQFLKTINAPIDTIYQIRDSLFIEFQTLRFSQIIKLKKDKNENIFTGKIYTGIYGSYECQFSRDPVIKDYKIQKRPEKIYTRQDSLRGSVTPERQWSDLKYYHLQIIVDVKNRTIKGSNEVQYKVLEPYNIMQIDLQKPLEITKVLQSDKSLDFKREENVYFIELEEHQEQGAIKQIEIFYEGTPKESFRPPWDGGLTWSEDSNGNPWIATSCQGEGASLWWPNKDHMYDEVDSMTISVSVPKDVMAIANGRLIDEKKNKDKTRTYSWFVQNPINNYGVNVNIGDYSHFSEVYQGENGPLTCDYYVLHENLEKAKGQFMQVPMMLEAFEHWFGPYPFYEDGYKLVEVPYLGMEHQSSVTYGNEYQNGYLGRDLSQTGWGLKFDYIIIHESGHEWFANNITYKDIADMWIHEGFTMYSECLYLEYHYGKKAAEEYLLGLRKGIRNDKPLIGHYEVNDLSLTGDIYTKGATILHTIRQVINNDEIWRSILRGLNMEFYHKTVTTADIENYISAKAGRDLKPLFDVYLRSTIIPTLEYYFTEEKLVYRWINVIPEFDMPVKVYLNGIEKWIYPLTIWTHDYVDVEEKKLTIDPNFYIAVMHNTKNN